MNTIRAKFTCNSSIPTAGEQHLVTFSAVTSGSEENKSFSRWTPSGRLELLISDEAPAATAFTQGKEYYLDITEAE